MYKTPAISARFVRRVHRRLVLFRATEAAGMGSLLASGLCLLLFPTLMWRGQDALGTVATLLTAGALLGLVWVLLRRPTVLDAAAEADRQLALYDLLTTTWALLAKHTDGDSREFGPFERAVLATADARCRTLAPSSVILNRFGARVWGGIGLAAALVLALGVLSADPAHSFAGAEPPSEFPSDRRRGDQRDGAADPPDRFAFRSRDARGVVRDDPEEDRGTHEPSTNPRAPGGGGADSSTALPHVDGSGAGRGQSPLNPSESGNTGTSRAFRNDPKGETAGGAGSPGRPTNAKSSDASGNTAASISAPPQTPAWSAETWPAARGRAEEAIRSNRVPAEYHEMIRAYFDR